MTTDAKLYWLLNDFIKALDSLDDNANRLWGKMNLRQMIEHMIDSVRIATEKNIYPLHTPEDKLPLFRKFMLSEKEFSPETVNPLMDEYPVEETISSKSEAVQILKQELQAFEIYFRDDPDKVTLNPIFGFLNFDEWVQLLYKHSKHHLKQFGADLS